jgi:hypothetical protein
MIGFLGSPFNFAAAGGGGDPSFANVVLLLHCDGTNGSTTFTDSSSAGKAVTAFNQAQISTTDPKFGTGAALFDGTTDYLTVPASSDWAFGTGDFTVEYWVKANSTGNCNFMGVRSVGGWNILIFGGAIYWQSSYNNTNLYNVSSSVITNGSWHHVAHCRSGTSHRIFIDGTQSGSTITDSTNYTVGGTVLTIGSDASYGSYNGRFDDIRITKGVARYTANFTPPSAPFPDS